MSTSSSPAPAQPRGIDFSLPTCGETQCGGRGVCVSPPGGGAQLVCECELGYQGESCDQTVNGALSVPLTVSVIAVILGLLILAFILAKMRQRQKRNRSVCTCRSISSIMFMKVSHVYERVSVDRRQLAARQGYNISILLDPKQQQQQQQQWDLTSASALELCF
ncbi:hypothetical protein WMY93_020658 [Mugilogobius chulae]|uniref:EGF-like domain-containing protein n=1 Tax=Mugilogobius chulae TaxID=88201 RepID=A0AAW0NFK5_9GOBI